MLKTYQLGHLKLYRSHSYRNHIKKTQHKTHRKLEGSLGLSPEGCSSLVFFATQIARNITLVAKVLAIKRHFSRSKPVYIS